MPVIKFELHNHLLYQPNLYRYQGPSYESLPWHGTFIVFLKTGPSITVTGHLSSEETGSIVTTHDTIYGPQQTDSIQYYHYTGLPKENHWEFALLKGTIDVYSKAPPQISTFEYKDSLYDYTKGTPLKKIFKHIPIALNDLKENALKAIATFNQIATSGEFPKKSSDDVEIHDVNLPPKSYTHYDFGKALAIFYGDDSPAKFYSPLTIEELTELIKDYPQYYLAYLARAKFFCIDKQFEKASNDINFVRSVLPHHNLVYHVASICAEQEGSITLAKKLSDVSKYFITSLVTADSTLSVPYTMSNDSLYELPEYDYSYDETQRFNKIESDSLEALEKEAQRIETEKLNPHKNWNSGTIEEEDDY